MNIETRKLNLINWISSLQEEDILEKMEIIQKENADLWKSISEDDKKAIIQGLEQLDNGESLTRSEVRNKIKSRFNL